MKTQDQIHLWTLLTEATDVRAFVGSYVEWRKSKKSDYGYASLARDAGFSARSYPRGLANGTRQFTAASIPRFAQAMKLTGEAARLFSLLAAKERPDFAGDLADLEKSREKLRRQIQNRNEGAPKVYAQSSWPLVYAALGTETRPATLEEISLRCDLQTLVCKKILKEMLEQGIVAFSSQGYYAVTSHLVYQDLGKSFDFQNFFFSSLRRAEKNAKENFSRNDHLFFSSAVSIRRQDLKKFRDQLRDLMSTFAEGVESDRGDEVVNIVSALFPQK